MIRYEVVSVERQQYIVRANEPFRVEAMKDSEIHIYLGDVTDMEQSPVLVIDWDSAEDGEWQEYRHGKVFSEDASRPIFDDSLRREAS